MKDKNSNKIEKKQNSKEEKRHKEIFKNNTTNNYNISQYTNAFNVASNYSSALNSWQNIINNILPKAYINTMSSSLFYIQNILPQNDIEIMTEMLLHKNTFLKHNINSIDLSENIYLSNIIDSIIFKNNRLNNINIYYKDAVEICMNEILNAKIDLTDLYMKSKFTDSFSVEEIEKFSEEDKKETIKNVKEIVALSKGKSENKEQLLNKKINKLKEEHPVTFLIIPIVFQILLSILPMLFTQNSNEYYINNYYINNYYTNNVLVVENSKQDFIDNARYVIAENLNVRSGASKEYNVLAILKYGTVVKIKEKVKCWTKIEYRDKDNDINLEGWVYTRYLEKFDLELLQK